MTYLEVLKNDLLVIKKLRDESNDKEVIDVLNRIIYDIEDNIFNHEVRRR